MLRLLTADTREVLLARYGLEVGRQEGSDDAADDDDGVTCPESGAWSGIDETPIASEEEWVFSDSGGSSGMGPPRPDLTPAPSGVFPSPPVSHSSGAQAGR
jgi:hypothetical protein